MSLLFHLSSQLKRRLVGGLLVLSGTAVMFVGGALDAYIQRSEPFLNDHVAQEFVSCVIDQELLGPKLYLDYYMSWFQEFSVCATFGEWGWGSLELRQGPRDRLEMIVANSDAGEGYSHLLLERGLLTPIPSLYGTQTFSGLEVLQDNYPINEAKIVEVLVGNLEPNWKAIMYHVNEAPLVFFPEILIAQSNWMVTRRLVPLIYHNPGVRSWLHYTFIVPGLLVFCLGIAVLVRAGHGKAA